MPSSEDRIACAVVLQARDQGLEARDQAGQLVVAVGDVVEHVVEVVDQVADHLVAVGQGLGDRRGVPEQALQRAALALEDLHELVGELVDVVGRERLEERLEAVEEHGQVESRRRALHRDLAALVECLGVADLLGQREIALADQVAVADRGVRRLVELGALLDRERDQCAGPVDDLDVLDAADLDAGDPDVVALHHPGRVDELGLVLLLAGEGEVADRRHQDAGGQRRDHDEDHQLHQVVHGALVEAGHQRCASPTNGPDRRTPRSESSAPEARRYSRSQAASCGLAS